MSKNCKNCWELNENPLVPLCMKCYYTTTHEKSFKKRKVYQNKISKVWQRRKKRIKEKWSEFDLFKKIAVERSIWWCIIENRLVRCEVEWCWKLIRMKDLTVVNFDHEKPKSWWEARRLDKKNIKIKCFACHFKKSTWLNLKVNYTN